MSDFFSDPRHPNRPQTHDFWKISEIILQLDGAADEDPNFTFEGEANKEADAEALMYAGAQRAKRLLQLRSPRTGSDLLPLMMTMWAEGFIVGSRFNKRSD